LMQILHTHGYMKISNSTDVMEAQFSWGVKWMSS
jgi:hypothetical protein